MTSRPLLLSLLLAGAALAADVVRVPMLTLPNGKVLKNVELKKESPSGASYRYKHAGGSGFGEVQMKDLPPAIQKTLGYDPSAEKAEKDRAAAKRQAEAAAPTITALSMTAKMGSAGRNETENWKAAWGSYQKDIDQTRSIAVSLRNGSDRDGVVYLETIWLTNGPDGKGQVSGISRVARARMFLKARDHAVGTMTATFGRTDNNYKAIGVRDMSGAGFAGWIVRAVDPATGKVIHTAAMREPLKSWSARVAVGPKTDF